MAASTLAVHVDEDVGDSGSVAASGLGRMASRILEVEVFGVVAAFLGDEERDGVRSVVKIDGAFAGTASK